MIGVGTRQPAEGRHRHHRVRRARVEDYYAQHQLEELHPGNTVFEELDRVAPGWSVSQVRTLLGAFLFTGDAVDKRVSVLSGGEKAFVAIALYFSILKVHPTPFCVMDEIEAALDDANVTRYARYMRTLAGRTQFIVITTAGEPWRRPTSSMASPCRSRA